MTDPDELPDYDPTPEQLRAFKALSAEDLEEMDRLLLSQASARQRKVAYIVGMAMTADKGTRFKGIPDVCFAARVAELVQAGRLESFGDLRRMRYSEVRLPDR
jgi:Protein of unknown function